MHERHNALKHTTLITLTVLALFSALVPAHAQEQKPKMVHGRYLITEHWERAAMRGRYAKYRPKFYAR
jgi:hypothetical protein